METRQRMEEAQDNLEEWIKKAVQQAQQDVFAEDERLDDEDLKRMKQVDKKMKERGDEGLWSSVNYNIYIAEDEDGGETVELETFGVPHIPEDLDIDDEKRQLYNDVLSDYGVALSEYVEKQFQAWKGEQA